MSRLFVLNLTDCRPDTKLGAWILQPPSPAGLAEKEDGSTQTNYIPVTGPCSVQVVEIAKQLFGLQLHGRILTKDAAVAVKELLHERRGTEQYDYVLHDVFSGAPQMCCQ